MNLEPDVILERELDAPRSAVWRAFTDPAELAAWFGPDGVLVPRDSLQMDVRVGGGWSMQMHDLDGNPQHRSTAQFVEVVEGSVLESIEEWHMAGLEPTIIRTRIELHDVGEGRTLLRIAQGPHGAMVDAARGSWLEGLAKLQLLLAKRT